jgi:hypothetical protein
MEHATSSRILRAALFTLVPVAYLGVGLQRPLDSYGPTGRVGLSAFCTVFNLVLLLICLLSWNTHRVIAVLGLLACLIWLATLLLPVL